MANTPPEHWAYLWEAKGVQRYVFDSGPLRDAIGASDLVAGLAAGDGDLIGRVLSALALTDRVRFSRRAGGAFCLHADNREILQRVRALWRLTAAREAPGLEFAESGPIRADNEIAALKTAYRSGGAIRDNAAAALPPTGHPFTVFNPRTGRVVTGLYAYGTDIVPVDGVTAAQRRRAQALIGDQAACRLDRVAQRFLAEENHKKDGLTVVFPRNFEADEEDEKSNPLFPFIDDDRRIAVIHADLSGLGEIFRKATDAATGAQGVLDEGARIESIVVGAAQAAAATVLLPHCRAWPDAEKPKQYVMPARPVLLGGDDITILVRADLALPFAERLLAEIESRSGRTLSACAGIAVINAAQPFSMAGALAESLCKYAKKSAKGGRSAPYPSFLAFHAAQSTLREEYDAVLARELTTPNNIIQTGNPYQLGVGGGQKTDDLRALVHALDAAPAGRGKLLEVGKLLFGDTQKAEEAFNRWRKVVQAENPEAWKRMEEALRVFAPDLALSAVIGPVLDALELIDLGAAKHLGAIDDAEGSAP